MLREIPIRIRFTILASLFLLISCVALNVLSNASADHMVEAMALTPAFEKDAVFVEQAVLAVPAEKQYIQVFKQETGLATVVIVLVGSIATYFAAGYVLKPIRLLSHEVQRRNAGNLDEPIVIAQGAQETQQLILSFNQMMRDLQQSFLLQKEFSANAAHELRTPLAVMQAKVDVFALENANDPKMQELTHNLNRQLSRLSSLIEDLLWFSQDLPLESKELVALHPLLCDVAEELSALSAEKEIEIVIEPTNAYVLGQDRLLERVFYNLLENAVKYSAPRTNVNVAVVEHPHVVQVCISDEGEGIPQEYREAIFEPFFRVDKSRSRAIGGSGLGLAVCKRILDRHQAQICVLPNESMGSIFQITFSA